MSAFFNICFYFGISPEEFFDEGITTSKIVQEIINELRRLNDNQLSSIYTLIKNFTSKH